MALLNPAHLIIVPCLLFVTVPLAIVAGITTTMAFSVLILRVLIVYLEIALSLVPRSLASPSRQFSTTQGRPLSIQGFQHYVPTPLRAPTGSTQNRRRRSSASIMSTGSAVSLNEQRGLGIIPSVGPSRDYEGIGGWRMRDEDDELWTTVNPVPEKRHHLRSPSGGAATPGDGYLMMKGRTRSTESSAKRASPNSSRARTPTGSRFAFAAKGPTDGYFSSINRK